MEMTKHIILFFIILVAVYLANMWAHKMIKEQERKEAERLALLEAAAAAAAGNTTT